MNFEDPARECFEHVLFQDAHEAGQDDEFYFGFAQYPHKLSFAIRFQSGAKMTGWKVSIRNGEFARDLQNGRVEYVRDDDAGASMQLPRTNAFEYGATVGAFTRAKNAKPERIHSRLRNLSIKPEVE
jgi:hypothetical protein